MAGLGLSGSGRSILPTHCSTSDFGVANTRKDKSGTSNPSSASDTVASIHRFVAARSSLSRFRFFPVSPKYKQHSPLSPPRRAYRAIRCFRLSLNTIPRRESPSESEDDEDSGNNASVSGNNGSEDENSVSGKKRKKLDEDSGKKCKLDEDSGELRFVAASEATLKLDSTIGGKRGSLYFKKNGARLRRSRGQLTR